MPALKKPQKQLKFRCKTLFVLLNASPLSFLSFSRVCGCTVRQHTFHTSPLQPMQPYAKPSHGGTRTHAPNYSKTTKQKKPDCCTSTPTMAVGAGIVGSRRVSKVQPSCLYGRPPQSSQVITSNTSSALRLLSSGRPPGYSVVTSTLNILKLVAESCLNPSGPEVGGRNRFQHLLSYNIKQPSNRCSHRMISLHAFHGVLHDLNHKLTVEQGETEGLRPFDEFPKVHPEVLKHDLCLDRGQRLHVSRKSNPSGRKESSHVAL